MRSRRTMLTAVGGLIATTAFAGCSTVEDENGDADPEDDEDGVGDPEDVLRTTLEALFNNDSETANDLLHPESTADVGDFPNEDISITEVRELTLEEHDEWRDPRRTHDPNEIQEEMMDEMGASEVVHLMAVITIENNDEEIEDVPYVGLFDGEWLVYLP